MVQPQDKESVVAIFQLLEDHNKLAKKTGDLLETVLTDIHKQREHSERFLQLEGKLESMVKDMVGVESRCAQCTAEFNAKVSDLNNKREENKDKITELSLAMINNVNLAKDLINDKIDKIRLEFTTKYESITKEVATTAGKYGALVAVILSLCMMLIQWVISHPVAKGP
jgi:hypothetical protein